MKHIVDPGWDWYAHKTFNPAVRVGNLLFVGGLDSRDQRTGQMIPGTLAEQCEVIYRNLGELLHAAGAGYEDVVRTTEYVTDTAGYPETAAVRERYLGPDFPAATGVLVKGLLGRGALIEIEAMAVIP